MLRNKEVDSAKTRRESGEKGREEGSYGEKSENDQDSVCVCTHHPS